MADEFIKGLGLTSVGGLVWLSISAWFNTEGFAGTQLVAAPPDDIGLYVNVLLTIREIALWTAILGALTFWIVIPALREGRRAYEQRQQNSDAE